MTGEPDRTPDPDGNNDGESTDRSDHPGRHGGHPLPRRLESMAPGNRVLLALVGVVLGVVLMFIGLKIVSDEVNAPAPVPQQPTGG